jgi:hypothetical protein
MSAATADGVLAATHRLVQQAMTGEWLAVARTVEERRVLLDELSARAAAGDQGWLAALRQAMAESDAAVERMRAADAARASQSGAAHVEEAADVKPEALLSAIRSAR